MANHLKMDKVFSILTLHKAGWSDRQIAGELGIDRGSVARHIRLAGAGSKPATDAPIGSEAVHDAPCDLRVMRTEGRKIVAAT